MTASALVLLGARAGRVHARRVAVAATLVAAVGCAGGARDPLPVVPAPAPPSGQVCRSAAPATVVSFADAGLARAIRVTLQVGADEPLTCELLARVTRLHAPDAGIRDLSGIENLVRLGELHIFGANQIRDVTPLGDLPALTDLNLARNQIEDIGPLARLRTLTSLDLYGNPVRDITPVAELTGLIRLRLEHGPDLSHLDALRSLTRLGRLELGGNALTDVGPLASLTGLTRLSLADNPHFADVTPLAALTNLEVLDLGGTSVRDLAPLTGLLRITSLSLAGTRVFDLGPLLTMAGLSRLDLRGNMQLTDIQPLLFHSTLGAGDGVRLEQTGVSCRDVAALQARGVTVFSSCR
ncbi:MAG: leucine-rich repeat domain-containing protein [Gemmatimonadales bacterium]